MMVTLHKIFDDGFQLLGSWKKDKQHWSAEIAQLVDGVKCFDVGDGEAIKGIVCSAKEIDSIRLPYERCWFEFSSSNRDGGKYGLLAQRDHVSARFVCFYFNPVVRRWNLLSEIKHDAAGELLAFTGYDDQPWADTISEMSDSERAICSVTTACIKTMVQFLKMLACVNVEAVECLPDEKLQKARSKRGKLPLFSSWICVLRGKQERGEVMGGTHASPRLHYRRGHVRLLPSGDSTWVRECMVGEKNLGLVEKTYALGIAPLPHRVAI